jgi:hypothetical protein
MIYIYIYIYIYISMKILVTTYYGLGTPLREAMNSLRHKYDIIEYPLFRYYCDQHDAKHNYLDHFNDYVMENKPDYILWWYYGIPLESMEYIKRHNEDTKFILFNWDEPANWIPNNNKGKAYLFDKVFITCEETMKDYIKYGAKEANYLLPGYDSNIHYMIREIDMDEKEKYGCDISICCTNLYDDYDKYPNQYIRRKELIDDIYNKQDEHGIKFYIYGPEWLRDKYPKSYRWMAKYEETNKIFNYSKINLCTHAICDKNKYFNERFILILASGGLLYVDKPKGIEDTIDIENECIIIDKDLYIKQIKNILDNYEKNNKYMEIREKGMKRSEGWRWEEWGRNIINRLELFDQN